MALTRKSYPPATDAMTCRACGQQERASEGYPCTKCGTFICVICTLRGVALCRACSQSVGSGPTGSALDSPKPPATARA